MSQSQQEDLGAKYPVVSSEWNDQIEKTLCDIKESCEGYKWMNLTASKYSSRKYNWIMYIVVALGPITGTLALIDSPSQGISILIGIFSYLISALSAIVKFGKFEQKSMSYKTVASKYASLEMNIKRQLSLLRKDRVNAGEYLQWVSTSFDDLFEASPIMSEAIYNQWIQIAKTNNMKIPKEIGNEIVKPETPPSLHPTEERKIEIIVASQDSIREKKEKVRNSIVEISNDRFDDVRMLREIKRLNE